MENTKCKDFILQNHLNFSISQHANEMYIHDTLLMDTFVIFSFLQVLYLVFDKDGLIDNNGHSEVPYITTYSIKPLLELNALAGETVTILLCLHGQQEYRLEEKKAPIRAEDC